MKKKLILFGSGAIFTLAILFNFGGFTQSILSLGESVAQAAGIVLYMPIISQAPAPTPTPTATLAPTRTPTPKPSTTPTQGPTLHDVQVGAGGDIFSPQVVTIHAGDTVRWTWFADGHTVTSGSPPGTADGIFCSPNNTDCSTINTSNTGAVYTHTFNQVGSFPYFCMIHFDIGMTGTVNVLP